MAESNVMSIRLPSELFELVQGAAALLETTPNAVMKEGAELFMEQLSKRTDLEERREKFIERNKAIADRVVAMSAAQGGSPARPSSSRGRRTTAK
jgi:hypothetical protein